MGNSNVGFSDDKILIDALWNKVIKVIAGFAWIIDTINLTVLQGGGMYRLANSPHVEAQALIDSLFGFSAIIYIGYCSNIL